MWSLLVLFIGTLTSILIYEVESRPLRDLDIAKILKILNEQQPQKIYSQKYLNSLTDGQSDELTDSDDNSHYGSLKSREIVDLIEQATGNKDVNDLSSDYKEIINMKAHNIHNIKDLDDGIFKLKSPVPADENTLRQILSYIESQKRHKDKPRNQAANDKLVSNLVHSMLQGGEKHDREVIDGYSKIYVILNPHAIHKSNNINSLSDVISKISSISSAPFPNKHAELKKQRYKGFPVREGVLSRRLRRDSKEIYEPKDSMEDYKQKRARNDHGSGRTAIPYIRHRGDIYERAN